MELLSLSTIVITLNATMMFDYVRDGEAEYWLVVIVILVTNATCMIVMLAIVFKGFSDRAHQLYEANFEKIQKFKRLCGCGDVPEHLRKAVKEEDTTEYKQAAMDRKTARLANVTGYFAAITAIHRKKKKKVVVSENQISTTRRKRYASMAMTVTWQLMFGVDSDTDEEMDARLKKEELAASRKRTIKELSDRISQQLSSNARTDSLRRRSFARSMGSSFSSKNNSSRISLSKGSGKNSSQPNNSSRIVGSGNTSSLLRLTTSKVSTNNSTTQDSRPSQAIRERRLVGFKSSPDVPLHSNPYQASLQSMGSFKNTKGSITLSNFVKVVEGSL
eukprot:gene24228-1542_t